MNKCIHGVVTVLVGYSTIVLLATAFLISPDAALASASSTATDQPRPLVFWALNLSDFVPGDQVQQVLNAGAKHPENPVLAPRPGHWDATRCSVYGTVFFDQQDQQFKMWYSGGEDKPDEVRKQHGSTRHVGYATSTDGIHWTRPILGILELNGSRDNNLVLLGAQAPCVLKRMEEPDPEKRYMMFSERGLRTEYTRILYSSDGIRWKEENLIPLQPNVVKGQTHEPFSILYDRDATEPKMRWKGYSLRHVNHKGTNGGRSVGFYFAANPHHWQRLEHSILEASTGIESEIHLPHVTKFYDDFVMIYDAMEPWHDTQGEIAISRDGVHFERVQNGVPIVKRGGPRDHDGAKVCVSPRSLFVHDGKIWWYYTTSCNNYQTGPRGGRAEPWYRYTCLAQWREDGFAHLQLKPGTTSGQLETIKFQTATEGRLEIRFNVISLSPTKVELVDSTDTVMAMGWIKAGDHLSAAAKWSELDPSASKGSVLKLRVMLDDPATRLYSIKISHAKRAINGQPSAAKKVAPKPVGHRWTFLAKGKISGEPVVHEDAIYFGSWDERFYSVARHSGEKIWEFKTNSAIMAGGAVVGDCVVFGSRDYHVYGVHRTKGEQLWKFKVRTTEDAVGSGAGYWVACPPGIGSYRPGHADRIFIGSHHRRMLAINPDNGRYCWEYPTFNWILGRPTVADYSVYFGSVDGYLYAVDAAAGALNWRYQVGRELVYAPTVKVDSVHTKAITAQPLLYGNRIFIGAHDGFIHAVDAAAGQKIWTRDLGQIITARAAICGDKLVVVTGDGLVAVMRPLTGQLLWRHDLGATVHAAPVVHDDASFWIAPVHGELLRFGIDGQIVERIATGRSIRATPAVTPEKDLIVATCQGEMFCIRPK